MAFTPLSFTLHCDPMPDAHGLNAIIAIVLSSIRPEPPPCPAVEDGHCNVTQVANRAGSLADITGVIASHGINVQSLAVGSSEQPGRSRITVVVPRDDAGFADLKQKVWNCSSACSSLLRWMTAAAFTCAAM